MIKKVANQVCELLGRGEPAALATILNRQGSTPRTAGSKMVVGKNGYAVGTIGGGKIEAQVLNDAAKVLADRRPRWMSFDLNHEVVSDMDMICGGRMEVLIDFLDPCSDRAAVFNACKRALSGNESGFLVTIMTGEGRTVDATRHCFVSPERSVTGNWPFSAVLLDKLVRPGGSGPAPRLLDEEGAWFLVEQVLRPKTVAIFGAGHVSQSTARLAAEVGFRVVVADDRKEFANRERFPSAHEIFVLKGFESALSEFPVDSDTFVVIVTRGHLYDKEVLSQALGTDADYIGMIGSRRKREAVYAALKKEGITDTQLRRVCSPIGLSIGAETPEEIAVSIVAELIAHRAKDAE